MNIESYVGMYLDLQFFPCSIRWQYADYILLLEIFHYFFVAGLASSDVDGWSRASVIKQ